MAALTALRRLDLNWNPLGVADGPSLQTLRTIKQQVGGSVGVNRLPRRVTGTHGQSKQEQSGTGTRCVYAMAGPAP